MTIYRGATGTKKMMGTGYLKAQYTLQLFAVTVVEKQSAIHSTRHLIRSRQRLLQMHGKLRRHTEAKYSMKEVQAFSSFCPGNSFFPSNKTIWIRHPPPPPQLLNIWKYFGFRFFLFVQKILFFNGKQVNNKTSVSIFQMLCFMGTIKKLRLS